MQTTRLWTVGVFSTTTSRLTPPKPSSSMARGGVGEQPRACKPGSTQARATTLAPFIGPMSCS